MTSGGTAAPGGDRYERRDVPERGAWYFVASFIAAMVVLVGGITLASDWLWRLGGDEAAQMAERPAATAAPRLETNPAADLARLRADAERRLTGYGWVDRQAGIAHIPIDQAMDLVVTRAHEDKGP